MSAVISPEASRDPLEALKLVYRKHHAGDPEIGWDELTDVIVDCLCNNMGSNEFCTWIAEANR